MQKTIKIFLLALLFFSLQSQVMAFDTDTFAEDFYTKIQNKVTLEENVSVAKNINFITGLPPDLIVRLIQGNSTEADGTTLAASCGDSKNQDPSPACKEKLKKLIRFEIDLNQLQTSLNTHLSKDEIWANGTLEDSAFDLVVDLNIIDTIFFGKEADIPLARWSKAGSESNAAPQVGQRISGEPDLHNPPTQADPSTLDTQSTQLPQSPASPSNNGTLVNSNTPTLAGLLYPANSADNALQCTDPKSFLLLDLSAAGVNPNGTKDTGNTGDSATPPLHPIDPGTILFGDHWQGQSTPFATPILTKPVMCENPLYGGFYCRDPLGGKSQNADENSCDPLAGICKKCFFGSDNQDAPIDYCITWQFKQSQHSVFSSKWVEDSIQGYIDSGIDTYRMINAMAPLTPTQQQNQAGFLTHLWDLKRDPGKMLYIASKIPDQWNTEPKQISFDQASLVKQWETQIKTAAPAFDTDSPAYSRNSTYKGLSEQETIQNIEKQRQEAIKKSLDEEVHYNEMLSYYKNILSNLQNLNNTFQSRFEIAMREFPFDKITSSSQVCK